MTAQDPGLTGGQIGALEMLAGCPDGCTEAALKANGFSIGLLGGLIRAGFATATEGVVKAGDRRKGSRLGSRLTSGGGAYAPGSDQQQRQARQGARERRS